MHRLEFTVVTLVNRNCNSGVTATKRDVDREKTFYPSFLPYGFRGLNGARQFVLSFSASP